MLLFLSESALQSRNCNREITFAVSEEKEMVCVRLDGARAEGGMGMQLSVVKTVSAENNERVAEVCRALFDTGLLTDNLIGDGVTGYRRREGRAGGDARKRRRRVIALCALFALAAAAFFGVRGGWLLGRVGARTETVAPASAGTAEAVTVTTWSDPVTRELLLSGMDGDALYISSVALVAVALLFGNSLLFSPIRPDSTMGKLGLTGSARAVSELYVYGNGTREYYSLTNAVLHTDGDALILTDTGECIMIPNDTDADGNPSGRLTDVTDFAQLKNLTALSLSGGAVEDITPLLSLQKLKLLDLTMNPGPDISRLPELPALETLNLAYTDIGFEEEPADNPISVLLDCPKLKTLYLDQNMRESAEAALADAAFEIRYVDADAQNYEELAAAAADESVHRIYLTGNAEIPAGETLTIRKDVQLSGTFGVLTVRGTLELYGTLEMGMEEKSIAGEVIVEDGGFYAGGMGTTELHGGSFTVKQGGALYVERGEVFTMHRGALKNGGHVLIHEGGRFLWDGGTLENNGTIEMLHDNAHIEFRGDRNAITGTGSFIETKPE